eukprot:gene11912-biopygen3851
MVRRSRSRSRHQRVLLPLLDPAGRPRVVRRGPHLGPADDAERGDVAPVLHVLDDARELDAPLRVPRHAGGGPQLLRPASQRWDGGEGERGGRAHPAGRRCAERDARVVLLLRYGGSLAGAKMRTVVNIVVGPL